MKDYKDLGREIQKDPYFYFQTQTEKQGNKNLPLRFVFNSATIGAFAVYYLSKNQQVHRL